MYTPLLFGRLDLAELSFWLFFAFFIMLVIYLQRESRREGYPLEDDVTGRVRNDWNWFYMPDPKAFILPFGRGTVYEPTRVSEPVDVPNSRRLSPGAGSPIEPVGNPIGAGVGPGAFAKRADYPDVNHENHHRVVPMSLAPGVSVDLRDLNPLGKTVRAADGEIAGTVSDIWVDRSEMLVRYLEVDTGATRVLMPMAMVSVNRTRNNLVCDAINAADFANVPQIATPGQITRNEEEQVVAYFGGGYLYASRNRQEPLL